MTFWHVGLRKQPKDKKIPLNFMHPLVPPLLFSSKDKRGFLEFLYPCKDQILQRSTFRKKHNSQSRDTLYSRLLQVLRHISHLALSWISLFVQLVCPRMLKNVYTFSPVKLLPVYAHIQILDFKEERKVFSPLQTLYL